ncbi:translocation/assembly module TamB [Billgrantia azerbaijanica]|nr:translocation/assembly module TamB [Halomonas azerbaijanica]
MRRFPRSVALVRALLWLVIALPLWCLGLALLVLGLALSPWGTGLLLEAGAKRGYYELESAEGAPLDRMVLHGLRLEAGPAAVAAQRLELAWAEDCLLRGRLCIERLGAQGVRLRLADGGEEAAEPEAPGEGPGDISLPLPLEVRTLSLADVEVQLADGTRVRVDDVTTGAEAQGTSLELLPTRLAGLHVALPLSPGVRLALAEADLEGPSLTAPAIDAAITAQSPLPAEEAAAREGAAAPPLAARDRLALPTVELPLDVAVPELVVEDVTLAGPFDYAVRRLALTLTASGHRVTVAPLEVATLDTDASLSARLELRDDYPLEARLEAALWLPERFPELAGERVTLDLRGSLAALEAELSARGPVAAELHARVDALDPTLPFTASLESPLLQWPLPPRSEPTGENKAASKQSAEPYLAEDVSLRLEGNLTDYRTALSLQLEGPRIPRTRVALSGSGDREHFAWTPLSLTQGRASAVSRGRVAWTDGLDLEAIVRLDDVDPGRFTDAVAGRLSGDAELGFRQTPDGWRLQVPDLAISGELDGRPLTLAASLSGGSELRWDIERLDFRQGENRLSARGQVAEAAIDLRGELDLPALASLHEALEGSLAGRFAAGGSLAAPRLDLALDGESLAFAGNRLAALRLEGQASGLDDPAFDLSLSLDGLVAGGRHLETVDLGLEGRLSEHRLTLETTAGAGLPLSRAALRLEGGLSADRERYAGRIEPLTVASDYGALRLDEALGFEADLAAARIQVQPFCLRREQGGHACLDAPLSASAEQGEARLSLRELPMELLEAGLPEAWRVAGESGLTLAAEWRQAGAAWRARAELDGTLSLYGEDAYGQPWELPEARLEAALEATPERADLDLGLALAEAGRMTLDLALTDPLGVGRLDGRLRLDGFALSPYRTLIAGVETLEGALDGDIRIAGTRDAPRLDGRLTLAGLQASGADVPVIVRNGEVSVVLDGDRGRIDGFVATDDGRLAISGDAAWPAPDDWRVSVNLDGTAEPLLVAMPEFGRLRVAPDLRVRVAPTLLQVRGRVQVPWARLEVDQRPAAAVSPSPDEVIITEREDARSREAAAGGADAATAAALNEAGMAVDVRIELRLGPDMELEAHGLSSGLAGSLEVRQQNGPVQLFGDVNLSDGRFRAFGQDLLIRQGELLFSGAPDQPLLDFEAIRNPEVTEDGVIAGLRVEGFAAAPTLTIFSEPAMDEARALSYLLRGRAPRDSDSDGALTSALIGLAVGQTGGAVGAIGQAFGIEDLSLETAGGGEDSQVVVSGYLSEDLRVSYGVGIFSPIAELALRYNLWRDLYLEAISGAAQAVDLVYTFSLPGKPPSRE